MGKPIQAKGMEHIRNLKKQAKLMWKEHNKRKDMWEDAVRASMLQHRLELMKEHKKDLQNETAGNPS